MARDEREEMLIDHYGEAFVYVVGIDIVNGPQKIGVARDMVQRLRGIQNGCPLPLVVNSTVRMDRDSAFQVEHQAHLLLKPHRMKGEWFRVTPEMAARAVRTAHIQHRQAQARGIPLWVSSDPEKLSRWYGPGRQPGTSPPEKKRTRRGPSIRSFG